jgi:hypothetical protein
MILLKVNKKRRRKNNLVMIVILNCGGIHHAGCEMEICPVYNDQLISCDCKNKAFLVLDED